MGRYDQTVEEVVEGKVVCEVRLVIIWKLVSDQKLEKEPDAQEVKLLEWDQEKSPLMILARELRCLDGQMTEVLAREDRCNEGFEESRAVFLKYHAVSQKAWKMVHGDKVALDYFKQYFPTWSYLLEKNWGLSV